MQENTDPCSLWTLLGVAVRIGQGLGLHRDGTSLGLSPFEIEMRRRLWWNIVVLDARVCVFSESLCPVVECPPSNGALALHLHSNVSRVVRY